MNAPHLPPKTNSLLWRKRLLFARSVFLVVLLAVVAGATAALVVLAWYPQIIGVAQPTVPAVTAQPRPADSSITLTHVRNATVQLFRARDAVRFARTQWYPKNKAVGAGLVLTEDGWIITTTAAASLSTDMRIVDAQGVVYTAVKRVDDTQSGLSFIKIEGESLSVIALSGQQIPRSGDRLWYSVGERFAEIAVGAPQYSAEQPLNSDRVERYLTLSPSDLAEGQPVFDNTGALIGLAHKQGGSMSLATVRSVQSLLPMVFSERVIPSPVLRISYAMMPDVVPVVVANDPQAPRIGAFVVGVERLVFGAGLPSLQQGDIITAVAEEQIRISEDLSTLLARLRPAGELLLTVYRDGQQILLPVVIHQ